ncbi:hypothetical protein [Ruegeria sp. HKCCD4332]|uniref:hypothetical protein n=1 Tax=Ruegeria sp. HKCCD4332 TaxID=2683021 RepID=UPI0014928487|nr:hypothetical protein [Ruegeria sp. HKCCD4332]NOD78885.1 hypothetical protein [Ruegeria sp. HKCCD4332]
MGIPPVFYHMQDVDVELKVVMEMSSEQGEEDRLFSFLWGPKLTQTDTLDSKSASTMRMRFVPGPVHEDESGRPEDG